MNPVSFVISRDRAAAPTIPYRMVEGDRALERIGHGWRYGAIAVIQAVGADAWALVLQPSGRPIARIQDSRVARAMGMMAATWDWPADGAAPPHTVAAWAAIAADLRFESLIWFLEIPMPDPVGFHGHAQALQLWARMCNLSLALSSAEQKAQQHPGLDADAEIDAIRDQIVTLGQAIKLFARQATGGDVSASVLLPYQGPITIFNPDMPANRDRFLIAIGDQSSEV